jgi:hypothetical protein
VHRLWKTKLQSCVGGREHHLHSQAEIFDRAAACELIGRQAGDLRGRTACDLMRDLWIALANEAPYLQQSVLIEQVDLIETISSPIHAGLEATSARDGLHAMEEKQHCGNGQQKLRLVDDAGRLAELSQARADARKITPDARDRAFPPPL